MSPRLRRSRSRLLHHHRHRLEAQRPSRPSKADEESSSTATMSSSCTLLLPTPLSLPPTRATKGRVDKPSFTNSPIRTRRLPFPTLLSPLETTTNPSPTTTGEESIHPQPESSPSPHHHHQPSFLLRHPRLLFQPTLPVPNLRHVENPHPTSFPLLTFQRRSRNSTPKLGRPIVLHSLSS